MSSPKSSRPAAFYLASLLDVIPFEENTPQNSLLALPSSQTQTIEYLLRLVTNAPYPPDATPHVRECWQNWQSSAQLAVRTLLDGPHGWNNQPHSPESQKRKRDLSPDGSVKKPRAETDTNGSAVSTSGAASMPADDPPIITLHSVSTSAPARRKYDITLHARTLRLSNPTTHATDTVLPLSSLEGQGRAFLLPTRGKAKKGWTVVIMSADVLERNAKGKGKSATVASPPSSTVKEQFQLIFSIDAEPTAPFSITTHPSTADGNSLSEATRHPKGTSTHPLLLGFLSRLPCPILEPSPEVFRSSASADAMGIAAYKGAKEETLWFFKEGILDEGKRCEFWPLHDLDMSTEETGDAVRLLSATGRTCSLFIRRKPPPVDVDADEDGDEPGEETEFAMIDGREQEGIREWVRTYRQLFGRTDKSKGKEKAPDGTPQAQEDGDDTMLDSDEDDSDFEVSDQGSGFPSSSDSDSGSDSGSGSASEEGSGEEDGSEAGSDDVGDEDGERRSASESGSAEEEDEEEPLDPAHHPLMQPGAMPRMSKAAMDMAVGIVMNDLTGKDTTAVDEDSEEDELDE